MKKFILLFIVCLLLGCPQPEEVIPKVVFEITEMKWDNPSIRLEDNIIFTFTYNIENAPTSTLNFSVYKGDVLFKENIQSYSNKTGTKTESFSISATVADGYQKGSSYSLKWKFSSVEEVKEGTSDPFNIIATNSSPAGKMIISGVKENGSTLTINPTGSKFSYDDTIATGTVTFSATNAVNNETITFFAKTATDFTPYKVTIPRNFVQIESQRYVSITLSMIITNTASEVEKVEQTFNVYFKSSGNSTVDPNPNDVVWEYIDDGSTVYPIDVTNLDSNLSDGADGKQTVVEALKTVGQNGTLIFTLTLKKNRVNSFDALFSVGGLSTDTIQRQNFDMYYMYNNSTHTGRNNIFTRDDVFVDAGLTMNEQKQVAWQVKNGVTRMFSAGGITDFEGNSLFYDGTTFSSVYVGGLTRDPLAANILDRDEIVINKLLVYNSVITDTYLQEICNTPTQPDPEPEPEPDPERDAKMKWWRDAKFGMFIHYGLYSGLAGSLPRENGGTYTELGWGAEWIQMKARQDTQWYEEKAMPLFNPTVAAVRSWTALAAEAGCKYAVLTSKHHDGFALFESDQDNAYGKPYDSFELKGVDIVAEFLKSCETNNLRNGLYFSVIDWRHLDFDFRRGPVGTTGWGPYPNPGNDLGDHVPDHDVYKAYMHKQVDEILSYPQKLDILWWDFSKPEFNGTEAWDSPGLIRKIRAHNKDILMNNRLFGSNITGGALPDPNHEEGDFSTPEGVLPDTGRPGVDWETCMTLNKNWGYNEATTQDYGATVRFIKELVDAVSKGGNYLLNISPKGDGSIPAEAVTIFTEIGAWMDINGEAIYGTTASPFSRLTFGKATFKADAHKIYLFLFNDATYPFPPEGTISLPIIANNESARVYFLDGNTTIAHTAIGENIEFTVPQENLKEHVTVICLENFKLK